MELLQCDIMKLERQPRLQADTVITNPPFGTRRKGADLDFLRAAFRVRLSCLPFTKTRGQQEYQYDAILCI